MFKFIFFQSHWLLGISAGLVLAVMGVTGAVLSYENALLGLLNPGLMRVTALEQPRLAAPQLINLIATKTPTKRIGSLSISNIPGRPARVGFLPDEDETPRPRGPSRMEMAFVDPYTAELLGWESDLRGHNFLHLAEDIHRRLAGGDRGKAITGACTLILLWLCISGIYLRWPRRALQWRVWLIPRWRLRKRAFLNNLHAVVGTWALLFYLLAGLSGLFWSYDWYRQALFALTASTPGSRPKPPTATSTELGLPDLQIAWTGFLKETAKDGYSSASFNMPGPNEALQINYLEARPQHERANNRIALDLNNGNVQLHERYAEKTVGEKLMSSMFVLHRGSFFGSAGTLSMMLASLGMPLFAITGWIMYLQRRKTRRRIGEGSAQVAAKTDGVAQA